MKCTYVLALCSDTIGKWWYRPSICPLPVADVALNVLTDNHRFILFFIEFLYLTFLFFLFIDIQFCMIVPYLVRTLCLKASFFFSIEERHEVEIHIPQNTE